MDNLRNFVDGRIFLTDSPFRSAYFMVATVVGLVSAVIDVYLLFRHWQTLNVYIVLVLGILIGVQLVYQWVRTLRYYYNIRKLYTVKSEVEAKEGTPLDIALRIATGGLTDTLFYCYGMILVEVITIGVLLTRLDGMR
jgi:hypothetical protein